MTQLFVTAMRQCHIQHRYRSHLVSLRPQHVINRRDLC